MTTKLPTNYVAAKQSLAKCVHVDECKTWANKAAALASYAKQMKDQTLETMAARIKARAIKRGGELLLAMKAKPGGNSKKLKGRQRPISSRKAASNAGLSERQAKTMVRVASVPEHQFESLVEAPKPATVEHLAELGKRPAPTPPPAPYRAEYLDWAHAVRHLAALPACGLDVLANRGPYGVAELRLECKSALENLTLWLQTLEKAYVQTEDENDAA